MDTGFNQQERASLAQRIVDDEIDLLQLWQTIWRRKWSIITLTLVVMMLAALVVLSVTPIYKGVSTLLIEQKAAKAVSIEDIYGLDGGSNEYLQTQFELLKSRELAERVVRELNLTTHPELDPRQQPEPLIDISGMLKSFDIRKWLPIATPADFEASDELTEAQIFDRVVLAFMERTTISPVMKTQLVKVEVEMADAALAAQAANALANAYIESQLEAKLDMTQTATNWMNERLSTLKSKLQESERNLQAFREAENLVDLEGVTTVAGGELSQTGDRLIDARRSRAEAESQYRQVASMKSAGWERLATVPAVLSNPLVQQFKAEEGRARSKVQELSRRYGPKHPKMISANTELSAASANLRSQVEQVVASIEREYQLATANERSLQGSFNRNKEQIQDIKRKEFKLRELQREVDSNRSLYDTFMTRLKETSATSDFEAVNARIVDPAVVPEDPVKPKKSLIVAIAGLLAMMAGIGMVLLLEFLNNTFKSTEDVEGKLNLPVLGILPMLKGKQRTDVARMVLNDGDKAFTESIRTIRTGVVLSGLDNPHKVLVVTSSIPGEGKSSVAANLAFAMAQMEKVLLIDADMRRPTVAKNFEFPVGTPGLANLVAGTAKLEDCIKSVEGDVDIISAGTVPPNPLELLSSQRFAKALQVLESRYDRIIIDSPPTQAVSDALVLSTHANALIYVIKSESTAIPLAKRGVGQLLQNNAPVTGVVLNQVDVKKAKKYGYNYGGYYDYYGYSGSTKEA
ncbi:Capsular polysaccharide synthesis enzyme CpsD, exopolysaccharide synthesis [Marinobacterium lacunae]|uniref:non-specific protein-tyrosine kinase n=1 Tax=Marinobacterium lacunae TaxID=1232683 RepID=A0A081G0A7_9GAMM|nr:polysaccharide biosynthesis tyrosine autokinase [Marinobacterium lacunae]KEA64212.1 Capsular polysaccharide synthesis enzyme CpsD, exopolysaccharide synthesis [Marinobacterium lacunae]